jgi:hypothetical protein
MTEPVTKADKEAGVLSKTAQKHLIEVYIAEKYGRKRDIQTKQMKKGVEAEQDSIDLLSMYLKLPFSKNEERFKNDFITGLPDIINGDTIIDIKSSYDLWTFLGNIPDKLDNLYYWQMQSYMWLTGTRKATIAYCLVNTPESIIQQEKYYLLKKMDVISEESPEFIKEAMKVEFNMTFDDISINERILTFNVNRSEDDILRIENKVIKARTFLQELEQTHLNFNNEC